jgi:hypothetical protein
MLIILGQKYLTDTILISLSERVKVSHGDFLHVLNEATHTVGPWAGIE